MVSKYRDILEPPAEIQIQRSSPVMQRATPTQGMYSNKGNGNLYFPHEGVKFKKRRTAIK